MWTNYLPTTYTSTITTTAGGLSSGLLQWSLNCWSLCLHACPLHSHITFSTYLHGLHIVLIKPWIRSCHSHTLNSPKYSYLIWERFILYKWPSGPFVMWLSFFFLTSLLLLSPATWNYLLNTPSIFCLGALNLQYPLPGRFSLGAHTTSSFTFLKPLFKYYYFSKALSIYLLKMAKSASALPLPLPALFPLILNTF